MPTYIDDGEFSLLSESFSRAKPASRRVSALAAAAAAASATDETGDDDDDDDDGDGDGEADEDEAGEKTVSMDAVSVGDAAERQVSFSSDASEDEQGALGETRNELKVTVFEPAVPTGDGSAIKTRKRKGKRSTKETVELQVRQRGAAQKAMSQRIAPRDQVAAELREVAEDKKAARDSRPSSKGRKKRRREAAVADLGGSDGGAMLPDELGDDMLVSGPGAAAPSPASSAAPPVDFGALVSSFRAPSGIEPAPKRQKNAAAAAKTSRARLSPATLPLPNMRGGVFGGSGQLSPTEDSAEVTERAMSRPQVRLLAAAPPPPADNLLKEAAADDSVPPLAKPAAEAKAGESSPGRPPKPQLVRSGDAPPREQVTADDTRRAQEATVAAHRISLGEVEMHERLGAGAFGEVRKAVWRGSVVAVKLLHETRAEHKVVSMFYSEASLLCRMRHPNIVQCLGVSTDPGAMAMVHTTFLCLFCPCRV